MTKIFVKRVKRVINFVIQFLSDLMFCDEHIIFEQTIYNILLYDFSV